MFWCDLLLATFNLRIIVHTCRYGVTPGICFVFLLIDLIKYSVKCYFSTEAILFPVYILYILVVGNTPYGKRHITRSEPGYGELNILE